MDSETTWLRVTFLDNGGYQYERVPSHYYATELDSWSQQEVMNGVQVALPDYDWIFVDQPSGKVAIQGILKPGAVRDSDPWNEYRPR